MTTIAHHAKSREISIDSRVCCGNIIMTDSHQKIKIVGDVVFILSGDNCDIELFVKTYPDARGAGNVGGFLVENKKAYSINFKDEVLYKSESTYNDADGDGYAFALAAMDGGASAAEAIEYAKTRNCKTGGKVRTYKY